MPGGLMKHLLGITINDYLNFGEYPDAGDKVDDFVVRLVEVLGMRAFFRTNTAATFEDEKEWRLILRSVLKYLHALKIDVTPRHLGAFSFFTALSEPGDFYIKEQHFVHIHPEYVGVFARFGGNMNEPISSAKPRGAKLSDLHSTPMIDMRQSTFTAHILERFGPDSAFYYFPVPIGPVDFALVSEEEGAMEEYIAASIGPRMLFDLDAPVTEEIAVLVLAQYKKCPEITEDMHFLVQAWPLLRRGHLSPSLVYDMAELAQDYTIMSAVHRYGASYRLGVLSEPEIRQLLCIPESLVMSDEVMERFIRSMLHPETGEFDLSKLQRRCRQITSAHVLNEKFQLTFMCENDSTDNGCQMLVPKEVDYRDYSVNDIFTYIYGNILHVVLADQLPIIAIGAGKHLDSAIIDAATIRWAQIRKRGLMFPPRPITEMIKLLVAPEISVIELLNAH